MSGKRLKELLTRKFGPLPAWAWFILLAAGVYIYRKRKPPPAPADTSAGMTASPGTDVSGTGSGAYYYPPGSLPPPATTPPPSTTPPPVTTPPPGGGSYPSGYWQHHKDAGDLGKDVWLYWNNDTQQWMSVSAAEAAGVPPPPSSYNPGQQYPPGSYAPAGTGGQTAQLAAKSMVENNSSASPQRPRPPRWIPPPFRHGHGGPPIPPQPQPKRPGYTIGGQPHKRLRTTGKTSSGLPRHRPVPPTATAAPAGSRNRNTVTPGPAGGVGRHRSAAPSKTGSARDRRHAA